MKKTYKLIKTFIVLLSLVTLKMGAQISGVVTINSGAATGGTNYQTFTALANALNTSGISGPLTVNVVVNTGPYVEQLSLDQITGMSATNTITINGNGNTLTYSGAAGNVHTVRLNGTDYLTLNNLIVEGTNTTYAVACLLTNSANYNTFSACTFSVFFNATSSQVMAFSFSSSGTTGNSCCGDPGNYNTVKTSTLAGGYYSIYHYGLSSGAYTHDNGFYNCLITDFYYSAIYCYYSKNLTIKSCTLNRLNRTSFTTLYMIYGWYSQGFNFDSNIIEKLYNTNQTYTGTLYLSYYLGYYNSAGAGVNPNHITNNIIRNIEYNGTIYGFAYSYYGDNEFLHNTFSFDHTAATAGSTYAFYYFYGGNGMKTTMKNNLISITRGGTGSKYGFYNGGNALSGSIIDCNNTYVNGAGGNNYVGYVTSAATNLTQWQAQGVDANGYTLNPNFANLLTGDLHPTNVSLNNLGCPVGISQDQTGAPRSQSTPDFGALEFLSVQCIGTPSANSIVTPTYALCPGQNANLNVANYTSDLGVTYQWLTSVSSTVGPWVPISGATGIYYSTPPLTSQMIYGVAITCSNAVGSTTAAGIVNVAGTTTNTVPYLENFDQIPKSNALPNCSWFAPSLGGNAFTYTSSSANGRVSRSGTSFASFYYNPSGTQYFYTNGIQLNAGITYSASVWYTTEYYGYNNWTDLSIMYGTTQTSVGLVTIASTNGPALSNVYKSLSNTFSVASSGLYYVAIRATGTTNSSAQYLSWDDLAIDIPCDVNSPSLTVTCNNTVVCSNEQVTIFAGGADSYAWNTGATTSSITQMPTQSGLVPYTVIGTSSLSGCAIAATQMILVNVAPNILAYASSPGICAGTPVNINAIGASSPNSYTWTTGANASFITVSPTTNTSYTVVGSNANGCVAQAVQAVMVYTLPIVSATGILPEEICIGELQVLTAAGAGTGASYQWIASGTGALYQGASINVSPAAQTVYTVTGTNSQGCSGTSTILQKVNECVGLTENKLNNVRVYPNPTSGDITLELNNISEKTITVMDVTGRVVSSMTSSLEVVNVNLNELSNGIYYVKIQSSTSTEVIKIVKQ
ncbi:T9SS type A sorting domain-containing protein [Aurantibacillus circumpalustris]|uniref:T9SS type A sorting domain-containing protein n=1 Tax=Aurantibacillus circumpalustris TaxID=3036359 RepID=UPI00295AFDE4|nr:T9SS type A sorting domain-containing protein [Aurantibacillus circumpalustris]